MSDPIADMLTRIRNAQASNLKDVVLPASKLKYNLAKLLQEEGYVGAISLSDDPIKKQLTIELKYYQGKGVIDSIKRVSRPSLRNYKGADSIPRVMGGLGVMVVSTSRGLMTDHSARKLGIGGELICSVS